ncbi:hypothetical protein ACVC7V_05495 [Hydrogenophaga sp. A37]|uniref:hypothetical protein n=1 Tax=Hydrogenophaga sp. A37 TaxID=1945864 RepID=UPI001179EFA4|nr:hypothetical protein [Hydrogenophaga sp. A37]
MNAAEHSSNLGKLVHNFQSLETWLRVVLLKLESAQRPTSRLDFESMTIGTMISVDALTDYSDLATLCRRFNRHMEAKDAQILNVSLVDIRDAIAHGRILGTPNGFPLRLVKFSKPTSGQVKLVVNEIMDHNWFSLQLLRTHRAIELVRAEAEHIALAMPAPRATQTLSPTSKSIKDVP